MNTTTPTRTRTPRKTAATRPAKGKAQAPKTTTTKKAPPAPVACRCGCGNTGKGQYRPGHDARHAGSVGRALLSCEDAASRKTALAALPSAALRTKATSVEARLRKQAAEKQVRAEAKAALQATLAAL